MREVWEPDLTAFLLGCSFGFEAGLAEAGIRLRHQDEDRVVPMYVTDRDCEPAGPFRGRLVVSMRPIPESRVDEAIRISGEQPLAHGAPVHAGDPAAIGIGDLARPDWGEDGGLLPGEAPVFWACGVTSQVVARTARPGLMISHAPGFMFVTDVRVAEQNAACRRNAERPTPGGPEDAPSSDESGRRSAGAAIREAPGRDAKKPAEEARPATREPPDRNPGMMAA